MLVGLNGVKCSSGIGEIRFNSGKHTKYPVQLGFDSASDMKLPNVVCKNIPMFQINVSDGGMCGSIESFSTNVKTGLSYNVPISIDGMMCNIACQSLFL